MATRIVGVGVKGTVSGSTITFDREISGDGLTNFTAADRILNLTKGENKALTGLTKNAGDRNKVVDATVATIGTWVTGDFYALMKDSGTVTYSTVSAAAAAASGGDEIIIYPRSNQGDRHERTTGFITLAINVTIETDTIGERNLITSSNSDSFIKATSACTLRDFFITTSEGLSAFRVANATGEVVIERCIIYGTIKNGGCITKENAGALRAKNCIFAFSDGEGYTNANSATGTTKLENCAALYNDVTGFKLNGINGQTLVCDNCVAYRNTLGYSGSSGTITGDNNVSSDPTGPTGTGNLINKLLDEVRPAFDFVDGQPTDWRFLDGGNSVLEDGGKVIAGLILDIDGRTRSGTTPNIGPTENFTRFGAAPSPFIHPGMDGGMRG